MAGNWFNQQHFPNGGGRLQRLGSLIGSEVVNQLGEMVDAIRFLTVVPLPGLRRLFSSQRTQAATPDLGLGSGYFPLVGLLLALVLSVLVVALRMFLPLLGLA